MSKSRMKKLFALFIAVFFFAASAMAQIKPDGFTVVELFTSQSCASCPPADKYFSEIAKRDDVIALGCHVTYWDHLDWKDTLAQDFCTERQRDYAQDGFDGRVYTPQMVINGRYEAVGAKREKIAGFLKRAGNEPIAVIGLRRQQGGVFLLMLPPLRGHDELRLYAVGYDDPQTVSMGGGENSGQTFVYANPVTMLRRLGPWDGRAEERAVTLKGAPSHIAVIAQRGRGGPIVAAGKIP
jgi:hypothetical protein